MNAPRPLLLFALAILILAVLLVTLGRLSYGFPSLVKEFNLKFPDDPEALVFNYNVEYGASFYFKLSHKEMDELLGSWEFNFISTDPEEFELCKLEYGLYSTSGTTPELKFNPNIKCYSETNDANVVRVLVDLDSSNVWGVVWWQDFSGDGP